MDNIPLCMIEDNGTFKYVQIQISNNYKIVVRGCSYDYHRDIVNAFKKYELPCDYDCICIGKP